MIIMAKLDGSCSYHHGSSAAEELDLRRTHPFASRRLFFGRSFWEMMPLSSMGPQRCSANRWDFNWDSDGLRTDSSLVNHLMIGIRVYLNTVVCILWFLWRFLAKETHARQFKQDQNEVSPNMQHLWPCSPYRWRLFTPTASRWFQPLLHLLRWTAGVETRAPKDTMNRAFQEAGVSVGSVVPGRDSEGMKRSKATKQERASEVILLVVEFEPAQLAATPGTQLAALRFKGGDVQNWFELHLVWTHGKNHNVLTWSEQ